MEKIAVAYILNEKEEVLMLKRSMRKKHNPGKWHTPAGKMEEGESPEKCIMRELEEELGIEFVAEVIESEVYVDTQLDGEWETYLFKMKYNRGNVVLNPENDEYTWVPKEQILEWDVIPSMKEDVKHIEL